MKNILLLIALVMLLQSCLAQNNNVTIAGDHALVTLPAGYKKQSKQLYPAIIFFPGKYAFNADTAQLSIHGPHKFVKEGKRFSFDVNGKTDEPILISVQLKEYVTPKHVDDIINNIIANYPVDKKHLYATGISAGCNCWLRYLNFNQQYASKIAAAVFISPQPAITQQAEDGSIGYKPQFFSNANIKCWILCGTSDSFWKSANDFAALLNKSKPALAVITPFKGFGHEGFWDVPYNPEWKSTTNHQSIYEWLLSDSR